MMHTYDVRMDGAGISSLRLDTQSNYINVNAKTSLSRERFAY